MKPRAERSVICGSDGKHSLSLPPLGYFSRHRNTDSGSLPPLLRSSLLTLLPLPSQTACCSTSSVSQQAALAFLASSTRLSISPSLTPIPIVLLCAQPGFGLQTPPRHSLSEGDPLAYCGRGKTGLRQAAPNNVREPRAAKSMPLSRPPCLRKEEAGPKPSSPSASTICLKP